VTEAEWLTCDDPGRLLRWVTCAGPSGSGMADLERWGRRPPDRKLRLYACACNPGDPYWEKWAEGHPPGVPRLSALDGALYCAALRPGPGEHHPLRLTAEQKALRAALLRCVVGNPWAVVERVHARCTSREENPGPGRRLLRVHDAWLAWHDGAVPRLAQAIYDRRDFASLPVLADALEEAGCPADGPCPRCGGGRPGYWVYEVADEGGRCLACGGTGRVPDPLLQHLRGPGPHARGCWVVDLILGEG
jgi:hypothetical protein